jgi:hypothetical protein
MLYIINITYRSKGIQQFRRNELISILNNIKTYFDQHNKQFIIYVAEQNNVLPFNRGILYNIAFIECEKLFSNIDRTYIHFNCDYLIDLSYPFPEELDNFEPGFMDIFAIIEQPILGGCCAFNVGSYIKSNGFPNNLYGWGGEDWAIRRRITENCVNYYRTELYKSGWVKDNSVDKTPETFDFDGAENNNNLNINLGLTEPIIDNGIDNCNYELDGFGEFHNGNDIYHILTNFN